MKDRIDEKNFREKVASSIIKRYNVKMVPGEAGNKREIGKKEETKIEEPVPQDMCNFEVSEESLEQSEILEMIVEQQDVINQQVEALFKEEKDATKSP